MDIHEGEIIVGKFNPHSSNNCGAICMHLHAVFQQVMYH